MNLLNIRLWALLFVFIPKNMQAQNQHDRLLFHYLKLSTALSRSDFAKAEKQAGQLAEQCRASGVSGLISSADNLDKAAALPELRIAFSPFSDSLSAAIRSGKIAAAEPLYLIHCPMAFNDQGADWISDEAKVLNPYFGDEMLHCGKVKSTFNPGKK
jgi:hypothetical protein